MDFSKLSPSDLDEFLYRDYSHHDVYPDLISDPIDQATDLFERLSQIKGVIFPWPVIDLYLASLYSGSKNETYTQDQILNLDPLMVFEFAKVLQFDPQQHDLQTNRERILRILTYLGVIQEVESESGLDLEPGSDFNPTLSQAPVIDGMCEELSLDDLNSYRITIGAPKLKCQVNITDVDQHINHLPYLDTPTYRLGKQIEAYGSNQTLIGVIENKEVNQLELLLSMGANPSATKTKYDWLHGETRIPAIVLAGIPQSRSEFEWDPVYFDQDSWNMVKLLIDAGADINSQIELYDGLEASVIWATVLSEEEEGQLLLSEFARYLVAEGADPNLKSYDRESGEDPNYLTPLMYAIMYDIPQVDLLLEIGSDPNIRDDMGNMAFQMESANVDSANSETRMKLVPKMDPNMVDHHGQTPLNFLVSRLYLDPSVNDIETLLRFDIDPNIPDNSGNKPLFNMLNEMEDYESPMNFEIFKLLVQVTTLNNQERTLLFEKISGDPAYLDLLPK